MCAVRHDVLMLARTVYLHTQIVDVVAARNSYLAQGTFLECTLPPPALGPGLVAGL